MYNADTREILNTPEYRDYRKGKDSYRVTVNKDALRELGVETDYRAEKDFNHRLPKEESRF